MLIEKVKLTDYYLHQTSLKLDTFLKFEVNV